MTNATDILDCIDLEGDQPDNVAVGAASVGQLNDETAEREDHVARIVQHFADSFDPALEAVMNFRQCPP